MSLFICESQKTYILNEKVIKSAKEIIDEISGFKMDSINEELSLDELTDLSRAVKNVLGSV